MKDLVYLNWQYQWWKFMKVENLFLSKIILEIRAPELYKGLHQLRPILEWTVLCFLALLLFWTPSTAWYFSASQNWRN